MMEDKIGGGLVVVVERMFRGVVAIIIRYKKAVEVDRSAVTRAVS